MNNNTMKKLMYYVGSVYMILIGLMLPVLVAECMPNGLSQDISYLVLAPGCLMFGGWCAWKFCHKIESL